jgi:hypothetical protein
VQITTISVGANADQELMKRLADGTYPSGGYYQPYEVPDHYHAEGSIASYQAQLQAIFQKLGTDRPVILIE